MKDKRAFWDASALLPLIVREDTTQRARQLLKHYPKPVVSWTTPIEIHSALSRLVREKSLNDAGRLSALNRLANIEKFWVEVLPSGKLRNLAIDLLRGYDLRAADSLQLASALIWCNEQPRRRPFIVFDERLAAAASQAGFDLE